jgi:hypothetical protein
MPLTYDDDPGSWGPASVEWPRLRFETNSTAELARAIAVKEHLEYGTYVLVGNQLRFETQELLERFIQIIKHNTFLNSQPFSVERSKTLPASLEQVAAILQRMAEIARHSKPLPAWVEQDPYQEDLNTINNRLDALEQRFQQLRQAFEDWVIKPATTRSQP